MDLHLILLLSNTFLLLVLGYLLKSFLPSYFSEKAKLLAQKEDISAITNEIEQVKSDHAKQVKLFEMQQALLQQGTSELRQSRTQTLLHYFECMVTIVEQELSDGFHFAAYSESVETDHYFREVDEKFLELRQNYYKILVFFRNDHPLLSAAGRIHECSLQLLNIFRSHYKQMAPCRSLREALRSAGNIDAFCEKLAETEFILRNYNSAMKPELEKAKEVAMAYLGEVNRYFGAFDPPSINE